MRRRAPGVGTRRRAARLALAALAVAATLMFAPRVALAHADLLRAEPAPDSTLARAPGRVRIWFTEPITPTGSAIDVLDATGRRVDHGDSRIDLADPTLLTVTLPALTDGTYTVAWHNTSTADGHPLRGTYVFTVGLSAPSTGSAGETATSGVSPIEPAVRWALLGGLLVALGAEVFGLLLIAPVAAMREARGADLRVERRIVPVALAVAAAASLAHLALQGASGALLGPLLLATRWGRLWLARLALIVAAAIVVRLARGAGRSMVAIAVLGAAVVTLPFASHAAGVRGLQVTAVGNDLVHALAAAAWSGGLVVLLVAALRARALPEARRRVVLHALARRFSPWAILAAAALVITGVSSAWVQVAAWAALATPYGVAVLAKGAITTLLVATGAANLLWVTRRLQHDARVASTLTIALAVEVALVAAALLAAGFLTSLPPARTAAGAIATRAEASSGSLRLRVAVTPGQVGTNRVEVRLDDRDRPLAWTGTTVTLRAQYAGADLGATTVPVRRDPSGAYIADGVVLSLQGPWQFEASVAGPGGDARAAVRLPIAPMGEPGIPSPAQVTALLAAGWEVVLLALAVLVVSEAFWRRTRTGHAANWSGSGLMVVGILMIYGIGHFHSAGAPAGGRVNPILSSAESIALGRELYGAHCTTCHGATGLGDGPSAATLNPPPASLQTHVPLHSDGEMLAFIEGGFPGSAMPAFRGALTEEQMWHLVNYLRTFSPPAR